MFDNYEIEEQMPYQRAVTEILQSAKILTADKTRVAVVFKSSKIEVNSNLDFISFLESPESCITALMNNLQYLPVIKVSAQRILRKQGIVF